jgi:hypothetical protein
VGTIWCECGEAISDAEVPSPHLHHLVADVAVEELVSDILKAVADASDEQDRELRIGFLVTQHGRPVYRCPRCGELLVFWDGIEGRATTYRPAPKPDEDRDGPVPDDEPGAPA